MSKVPPADDFVKWPFKLRVLGEGPIEPGEPVFLEAILLNGKRWNADSEDKDSRINLSAVLGNVDGEFVWGRSGFEQSGEDFRTVETNHSLTLSGKLYNLKGTLVPAEVKLCRFKIIDYPSSVNSLLHPKLVYDGIPHQRQIVLCFDGTSNRFGESNTNVVKLVELLKNNDPDNQMVYYQTGVGTYGPPGLVTSFGLDVAAQLDKALAWYLHHHVMDGYKFLMQSYRAGDRISIFGFSRGAFTARALAGMLHCVGLLPINNHEHIASAYQVYKNAQDYDKVLASAEPTKVTSASKKHPDPWRFKQAFCIDVKIDFVGVWDTVASVGALRPQTLPWIAYNPSIRVFRQALALDEHRGNFIPSVWDHVSEPVTDDQNIREVWFRGEHTDIGGGNKSDQEHKMLSNIALRWMIREVLEHQAGILFDPARVKEFVGSGILECGVPTSDDAQLDDYWKGRISTSYVRDSEDGKGEIYNTIKTSLLWVVAELIPLPKPTRTKNLEAKPTWRCWFNVGRGREVFVLKNEHPVFVHSSAVAHMQRGYKPRALWYFAEDRALPHVEDSEGQEISASRPNGFHSAPQPSFEVPREQLAIKYLGQRKKPGLIRRVCDYLASWWPFKGKQRAE